MPVCIIRRGSVTKYDDDLHNHDDGEGEDGDDDVGTDDGLFNTAHSAPYGYIHSFI